MEETVPIIHSRLMRRNRNFSKNPYGLRVSYLSLNFTYQVAMTPQEAARNLVCTALQWLHTHEASRLS
jgi:hypothetical protein